MEFCTPDETNFASDVKGCNASEVCGMMSCKCVPHNGGETTTFLKVQWWITGRGIVAATCMDDVNVRHKHLVLQLINYEWQAWPYKWCG